MQAVQSLLDEGLSGQSLKTLIHRTQPLLRQIVWLKPRTEEQQQVLQSYALDVNISELHLVDLRFSFWVRDMAHRIPSKIYPNFFQVVRKSSGNIYAIYRELNRWGYSDIVPSFPYPSHPKYGQISIPFGLCIAEPSFLESFEDYVRVYPKTHSWLTQHFLSVARVGDEKLSFWDFYQILK